MPALRPGIWLLDRLMKAGPGSIAGMDAEALARAQATVLPDRGPISLMLGGAVRGVRVTTASFDGSHGGALPLRIYTPAAGTGGDRPLVLYFHGGGFVLGSARQTDWISSTVARDVGAVVVSVDYRLAPAHPFPAAVEDCWDALVWAAGHAAELGADAGRLAVMGESAGGNLAAVTAIAARERGGPPIAHQTLLYPVTDMTGALRETASYREHPGIVLTNEDMAAFDAHYVPAGTDLWDWRLSPQHAGLSGLPPAIVVVAGLDPLHDIGVTYARSLEAAGVPVVLADYPGMPHGFLNFPHLSRSARPAIRAVVADLRRAVTPRAA